MWNGYNLNAPEPGRCRDLDETRRLLYSARYANRTKHHELAGTIVNALAHHGAGIPADVSEGYVLAILTGEGEHLERGGGSQIPRMAHEWVQKQIDKISELLGDG